MRISTMGALPPLQGEGRDSDVCDWKGWGGDGVIMHGKDALFPIPLPTSPLKPLKGEELLWQYAKS
jgi:hypothetical protein